MAGIGVNLPRKKNVIFNFHNSYTKKSIISLAFFIKTYITKDELITPDRSVSAPAWPVLMLAFSGSNFKVNTYLTGHGFYEKNQSTIYV